MEFLQQMHYSVSGIGGQLWEEIYPGSLEHVTSASYEELNNLSLPP